MKRLADKKRRQIAPWSLRAAALLFAALAVWQFCAARAENSRLRQEFVPQQIEGNPYETGKDLLTFGNDGGFAFLERFIFTSKHPPVTLPIDISFYAAPDKYAEKIAVFPRGSVWDSKHGGSFDSYPTHLRGWRAAPLYLEDGVIGEKTPWGYVRLEDLEREAYACEAMLTDPESAPLGDRVRARLFENDWLLYQKGAYLSPDLLQPEFGPKVIVPLILAGLSVIAGWLWSCRKHHIRLGKAEEKTEAAKTSEREESGYGQ